MSNERYEIARKKEIAKTYFKNPTTINKLIEKPLGVVEQITQIYNYFQKNPQAFQEFFQQKFRKKANSIEELNNPKLYGVLISKINHDAREREREASIDNFFEKEWPNQPQVYDIPWRETTTRGIGFGSWSFTDFDDQY